MGDDSLPPMHGEKTEWNPDGDVIPLYVQGATIPLTEGEALGVIAQLSSALQTRGFGMARSAAEVMRNGQA